MYSHLIIHYRRPPFHCRSRGLIKRGTTVFKTKFVICNFHYNLFYFSLWWNSQSYYPPVIILVTTEKYLTYVLTLRYLYCKYKVCLFLASVRLTLRYLYCKYKVCLFLASVRLTLRYLDCKYKVCLFLASVRINLFTVNTLLFMLFQFSWISQIVSSYEMKNWTNICHYIYVLILDEDQQIYFSSSHKN
jgi:hypothetical protein